MLIKLIISFICIGMSLFLMERNADKGLKNLAEVSMRHKDAEKIKVGDLVTIKKAEENKMNNTVIAMGEIGHGFPVKEKLDKIKLIKLELAVQILDEVSERSQQKENDKWVRLSDVEEVINKYLN